MATKYPNEIQTFPTMQDITTEDAVAVIVNAMSYYFVTPPALDEKYVQRIRNLRELPNYYMATALLKFGFENEKKDLD